ncbi:protein ALP1-like [Rana temporaria]|uniref:protein ALP1-like n=2 Tax=Rana temporaria TaxID=8407 RepID=UPI001AAE0883|nr:protein ALP1-like [Rana temporaria]
MAPSSFDVLLEFVRDDIQRQDTHLRFAVSPEQRLVVTLRFLASGESFSSLHYQFRLGKSTISTLVPQTCEAIWRNLQRQYLPEPTTAIWNEAAEGYWKHANFPNCVGALDGKHVRIRKPSASGSLFYNYKKYFSIILMAICDASYKFLAVDIGAYGQNNDSRVFKESNLGKALYAGTFQIPGPKPLPGIDGPALPHVIVADEAFQMAENLLKPYSGRRLNGQRRVFNYRLTRARRYVECAFGILTNKWRILTTSIQVKAESVDSVIKACVVLHNFVIKLEPGSIPTMEEIAEVELSGLEPNPIRSSVSVMQIREQFCNYFSSEQGALPWQHTI